MEVEAIRGLVQRGVQRQPELRCKLEHAAFIALFRAVVPQLDGSWSVGSERELERVYRVRLDAPAGESYCSCQDSARHPGQECKHSLAALLVFRVLADQLGLQRHAIFDDAPTPIDVFARFAGA